MPRKNIYVTLCLIALLSASAHACYIYSGSLTSGGGLIGTEQWASNASLSWTVSEQTGNTWLYEYRLQVPAKDISHIILETSPTFTPADASGFRWSNDGCHWTDYTVTSDDVKLQQISQGNNGMPSAMYGLKFDTLTDSYSLYWQFSSGRSPVWGDFYARDGKNDGQYVYLYNSGFTAADPTNPPANGSLNGHLLVPDTVPEPLTMAMLVVAGLGLLARPRAQPKAQRTKNVQNVE